MILQRRFKFIDSSICEGQTDIIEKPIIVEAVGFLIEETDEYITIARELVNGEYRGQLSIPRVALLKKGKGGKWRKRKK